MKIKKSPSAFTLIELLVVISIIAILASLAIPAVTSALTRGQMVQTLNNQRQLQIATQTMSLDSFTSGSGLSWTTNAAGDGPVDLNTYFTRLVTDNYLTQNDLNKLLSAPGVTVTGTGAPSPSATALSFFEVSENSPGDQPFVVTKNWAPGELQAEVQPYGSKGFVLFRKGGEGNMFTRPSDTELVFTDEMQDGYNQTPIN
ncbi:MAG: type II secretion system protein [Chthoniobacterales bacterium]